MFIKLYQKNLTDDLKNSLLSFFLLVMGAILGFLCLLTASAVTSVESELMWLFRITGGAVIIGSVVISVSVLLYTNFRKYYMSVYGAEAYFTFSLPVSVVEVLTAKVFSLLTVFMLFTFVGLGLITLILLSSGKLYYVFSFIIAAMGKTDYVFTLVLYLSIVLFLIVSVFFSLSSSGKSRKNRALKTGLTLALCWLVNFILTLLFGIIAHFFFPQLFYFGTDTVFFSWLPSLIVLISNLICALVLFIMLCSRFKKGVEL